MTQNATVAGLFEEMADRLAARDVEYKPRAYRRAAENIRDHPVAIEALAAEGTEALTDIEGVGDAIAEKIVQYVETGEIDELAELRAEMPVEIGELTAVEGVGPKTVADLYDELGITDLDELEAAAEAGRIRDIRGYGAKTEENILDNIPFAREARQRELLGTARPLADDVLTHLKGVSAVEQAAMAGSIRRWRPTIGDVDVLVASEQPAAAVNRFRDWDRIDTVIEAGEQKVSVRADDVQVDIRVIAPAEFGSALQYFTGSRDHNVRLRNRAIERDLKMSEYGIFDVSHLNESEGEDDPRAGDRVAGATEESMYAAIDLPWIPPELREDTGEVAAAAEGTLPTLLETEDVRGDLHVHTDWSDGNASLAEMAEAAADAGHEYLAICDHAAGAGMVGGVGLTDAELREQGETIEELRADLDIRLLTGVEANIDATGGIDIAEEVLAQRDIVVASPHSALDQEGAAATDRLIRAIGHEHVDVLGHPTGRLLNSRAGLEPDIEAVAAAAADHDTALEVNANPHRLDLDGMLVRVTLGADAPIAINTDAHSGAELAYVRYGVHTARRGWAEAGDVINTMSASELFEWVGVRAD